MHETKFRTVTLGVLSIAHLINDMYNNFLPQLLPIIVATAGFSVTKASSLVSAFTITSSLVQPVFGYLVDQKNQRWLVFVGTLWMAVILSLTGLTVNYGLLLIMAAAAGIGTAAFHPQASAMVSAVSGNRKGFIMSAFVASGNVGWAVAPVVLVPLFAIYGAKGTTVMVIPGIVAALFLYIFAPRTEKKTIQKKSLNEIISSMRPALGELNKLMVVVALRSLVYTGLITMLPLYFKSEKMDPGRISYLLFLMLFAGAAGGLAGGFISDKYGRRPLIAGSLVLATPFFYGFLATQGLLSDIFLGLGGAALLASFSVTVVAAQEAIPDNKAMAAGLSMGFAIGVGGLAVTLVGKFADVFSLMAAVRLLLWLPLIAGIFALTLNKKGQAGKNPGLAN
ncbi:MFS transporter, FSR family, fosmidomycin resistance protein [Desulfotomaculum arcticum]|uniref:MFS transporter, FSR family, fosmidomycin resistance protein n=1 Tax=Desulfotruncus arcticus DSM 17038 TaxID=1121424 RepID=A0A1I2SUF4_9FIRM|nr:MFS transporter [Desulfotruncus arcticus]SFG53806.1 MFS transporter, FSR family, fosmidomycin resistance protein [Desulfotomaculum arcticum] [Desulfotruncus arcticus DSM 17038]